MQKLFKKAVVGYLLFKIVTLGAAHFLFKVENGVYLINPKWSATCVQRTGGPGTECVELKFTKRVKGSVTQQ